MVVNISKMNVNNTEDTMNLDSVFNAMTMGDESIVDNRGPPNSVVTMAGQISASTSPKFLI